MNRADVGDEIDCAATRIAGHVEEGLRGPACVQAAVNRYVTIRSMQSKRSTVQRDVGVLGDARSRNCKIGSEAACYLCRGATNRLNMNTEARADDTGCAGRTADQRRRDVQRPIYAHAAAAVEKNAVAGVQSDAGELINLGDVCAQLNGVSVEKNRAIGRAGRPRACRCGAVIQRNLLRIKIDCPAVKIETAHLGGVKRKVSQCGQAPGVQHSDIARAVYVDSGVTEER